MKTNIPDFAVSSQEAGFDEFLKVFNEYFKLSCRGEFLFYGASDGQPQRDDIRWTNKFILPQEAIALLTGKQLTEGDLIVGNRFECIETFHDGRINFVKGNIYPCNRNSGISDHRGYNIQVSMDMLNRHFKLLPTQESVKDGSLGIVFTEQAENAFNHYEYPSLINTLDTSAAFWIGWRQAEIFFSTQQTAHLQQQLKEAKELLEKTTSFCEDENMYPTVYHSINQFLTRNK